MKISDGERLIIYMLTEVYKELKIKGEIDPDLVQSAIAGSKEWGLAWEYSGILDHRDEKDPEHVTETADILMMWGAIERGYDQLPDDEKERIAKEAEPFGGEVRFPGFDANNERHYGAASFMVEELGRFAEFKDRDLNSHWPSLDAYRRMLEVWNSFVRDHRIHNGLNADQIIRLLREQTHPESRAD